MLLVPADLEGFGADRIRQFQEADLGLDLDHVDILERRKNSDDRCNEDEAEGYFF